MNAEKLAKHIDKNLLQYLRTGEGLETLEELTAIIQQAINDHKPDPHALAHGLFVSGMLRLRHDDNIHPDYVEVYLKQVAEKIQELINA